MANPVYQDQREFQPLQSGLQYEGTSGYDGRESDMVVEEPAGKIAAPSGYLMKHRRVQDADEGLHGYKANFDTEGRANATSNFFGGMFDRGTFNGGGEMIIGNVHQSLPPTSGVKWHDCAKVKWDGQHQFGTIPDDDIPLAMATEALHDGMQRTLGDESMVPEHLRLGPPGHSQGHELEDRQGEALSALQVEPKRPSTKAAQGGRRPGRRPSSKVSLPHPEALGRGPSPFPGSASPTPISRNAYSNSRATTNTAASSKSLSTAGTFAFNTTMTVMAIVALVFAILGYKIGVASAQSGEQALKLSMWEDCIEHSDILANSATCKKLLDQGFDAIVSRSERFRGRRELEDVSDRCPCCLSELSVGRISSTVAA